MVLDYYYTSEEVRVIWDCLETFFYGNVTSRDIKPYFWSFDSDLVECECHDLLFFDVVLAGRLLV